MFDRWSVKINGWTVAVEPTLNEALEVVDRHCQHLTPSDRNMLTKAFNDQPEVESRGYFDSHHWQVERLDGWVNSLLRWLGPMIRLWENEIESLLAKSFQNCQAAAVVWERKQDHSCLPASSRAIGSIDTPCHQPKQYSCTRPALPTKPEFLPLPLPFLVIGTYNKVKHYHAIRFMELNKLPRSVHAILLSLPERRARLEGVLTTFTETAPDDTAKIAALQAQVRELIAA